MKILRYKIETLIVKLLFFVLKKISIDKSSEICGKIAKLIGPILSINNIAHKNIDLVFPDIDKIGKQKIINEMWENLGRVIGEFPHIYNITQEDFLSRVKINGIEHIENLTKNVIFFSGHLANWEVSPRIPRIKGMELALIYRTANNQAVDKIISNERVKNGINLISKGKGGIKALLRALKNKLNLAMLVDQKMNDGIEVPFFGKNAMTAPAIVKLAAEYDMPIIPAQVIRTKGAYFEVNISQPIIVDKSDSNYVYNNMLIINKMLEKWIIENPGQWFWLHKRWPKIY
ncbi:MAG: lipid A biosynthesis lauroyl acyltransferase [Alphaproteobacteria bacterium]